MNILSDRLELVPMTPEILEAFIANDRASVARAADIAEPPAWGRGKRVLELRLAQLRDDPSELPWLLRMMVLRDLRVMIGHVGFHAPPGNKDVEKISPGAVEIGYTVFEPHRRQGYATEAVRALIGWAHKEQGVDRFIACIAPTNAPSMKLALNLGFRRIASHVDEHDGPEEILELRLDSGPAVFGEKRP